MLSDRANYVYTYKTLKCPSRPLYIKYVLEDQTRKVYINKATTVLQKAPPLQLNLRQAKTFLASFLLFICLRSLRKQPFELHEG